MNETMGQIIRRLRKERNLTQEELAEQLDVTFQAVSKWENDAVMPDISQVVPIANVFGVSTDVLFGTVGINTTEEVIKIIEDAQSLLSAPITAENFYAKHCALKEGLKIYPNNPMLLANLLETGIGLAYPQNQEVYDPEHAEEIYHECERYANLVISYSKNASDIMRAHMIMVALHSAYGNFEAAKLHLEQFPSRADFNIHEMLTYYAHWKKDHGMESIHCQWAILHYLESMLNTTVKLSNSYMLQEKYLDAAKTLETSIELINCIFKDNEIMPPLHHREYGDMYMLIAHAYLKYGDDDKALLNLEKMVDYDLIDYERIDKSIRPKTPLLNTIKQELYRKRIDRHQNLINKLNDSSLDSLKSNERYKKLVERVEAEV